MKAEEFRKQQEFNYDHFSELTNTGIRPNYINIDKFAEAYHEMKLKKLRVGDVMKNEVVVCEHDYTTITTTVGIIQKCKKCQKSR